MLQFNGVVDRTTKGFFFEGIAPNARPTDLLDDKLARKRMQPSIDRAMFYVWADKIGTLRDHRGEMCVAGNYFPCWVEDAPMRCPVDGVWPDKLWKARKLSHETYEQYLWACRDGVLTRKRNLQAVCEHEEEQRELKEIAATVKRIRSNPALFRPFPEVPEATAWLAQFKEDALRYPVLVVLGPSHSGKTEWSKSLFRQPLERRPQYMMKESTSRLKRIALLRGSHRSMILQASERASRQQICF